MGVNEAREISIPIEPAVALPSNHAAYAAQAPNVQNDHWYLAQLKPGGFARAKTNLERQGFGSFMPMQVVTRTIAGRFTRATRPLFAGYLFVRVAPDRPHWRAINSTCGVARLVAFHSEFPTRVPVDLIADLRARCDVESRLIPASDFEAGERVRVVSGPFADITATLEAIPDAGRAWVLLEMMGRTIRATLALQNLEHA